MSGQRDVTRGLLWVPGAALVFLVEGGACRWRSFPLLPFSVIFSGVHGGAVGFPPGSDGKQSAYNAGDLGSIPRSGRSPGERNGSPLQHSCVEEPMDRAAWRATVHGVAESDTTGELTAHTWGLQPLIDNQMGHWCDTEQLNQRWDRPSLNSRLVRKLIPYSFIPLPFEFLIICHQKHFQPKQTKELLQKCISYIRVCV